MQIVLDNIIFSLQQAGGISAYWYELIRRLLSDPRVTAYEMPSENLFRQMLPNAFERESRLPVKLLRYLPFTRRRTQDFLFHSSYYRVATGKFATNVTTVHDFTYEHFSSGLPRFVHARQKRFAIQNSAGVICVSDHTRRDLMQFIPAFPEDRIRVIYNGVSDEFQPIEENIDQHDLLPGKLHREDFVLFVGARGGYKNFALVVDALRDLDDLTLVSVGGGPIRREERELLKPLDGRFLHFAKLETARLNQLYNTALCLVYPSLYEGFGIPVVEAMRAGCPVLACNSSSLPEVASDAALLLEEISNESLVRGIHQLRDPTFRAALIQRGHKQASHFSWDRCFRETLAFYQHIWLTRR
jgi:glycosyltransferase involved in cell wall biosynthesis